MSAKIISMGNSKGGVAKSTLASIFSTYLHTKTDYKICVLDLDYFQASLSDQREDDLKNENVDPDELFDLLAVTPSHLLGYIEELKEDYDYIFLDVPGNMEDEDLTSIYRKVDIMIIPFDTSKYDVRGTAKFYIKYSETALGYRESKNLKTSVYGILTKVLPNTKAFRDFRINEVDDLPFPVMKNYIPFLNFLKEDISTTELIKYEGTSLNIEDLCNEFIKILKSHG